MVKRFRVALSIVVTVLAGIYVYAQTGTVMPPPLFLGFDNNGLIVAGGKLCTYAAGTSTPQATYSDSGLSVPNTNPVILNTAGRASIFLSPTSYKFILMTPGTDTTCSTGSVLWSQDNIAAVPTNSGITSQTGTAGETITAGSAAYLSDGSGGKNAGQWYNADQANAYSSTYNIVGVTNATVTLGSVGTFILSGPVTGLSGLTVGAAYYVGTAGALTKAVPPINLHLLGWADTSTSLVLGAPSVQTSIQPVNRGGTGVLTLTQGAVLIGQGANPVTTSGPGTNGQLLFSNGTTLAVGTYGTHTQTTTANPTGTSNNSGLMMGLAGTITPQRTGTVLVCVAGFGASNTAPAGGAVQIRSGTGVAPSNGGALAGTATGSIVQYNVPDSVNAANVKYPLGWCANVTGLATGTAAWLDVSLAALVGGTATISNVVITANELP